MFLSLLQTTVAALMLLLEAVEEPSLSNIGLEAEPGG
jgi:hypothetical protein